MSSKNYASDIILTSVNDSILRHPPTPLSHLSGLVEIRNPIPFTTMSTPLSSLNAPTFAHLQKVDDVTRQIRSRSRAKAYPQGQQIPYLWEEYEHDIHRLLLTYLPQCVLGGVKLFSPSFLASSRDYGLEVDNILHVRHEETDYLVIIEAKNQEIQLEEQA